MNKFIFFTDDKIFISKIQDIFSSKDVSFQPPENFPNTEKNPKLVIVDGDSIPLYQSMSKLEHIKRKKIPVVYIFTDLDGKGVMEMLQKGAVSILFKESPGEWIKKELDNILDNFNYLERVKDMAENESRTRQFLKVINSLTSDIDINTIMNQILKSMVETFHLDCTIFFIVKNNRLEHKLEVGKTGKNYTGKCWELETKKTNWLSKLQEKRKPIYFKQTEKEGCEQDFPANTLLLPLVIKEQFLGMIAAFKNENSPLFTRNEIDLLKGFSEQTALALENAKLYWDVIKTRERLVKREKEALLSQTILSLNHEINNPLSIISMEAQLLQKRIESSENSIESRIARIEKNIDRIKVILEKISSLSVDTLPLTDYVKGKKMLDLYEHQTKF